MHTRCSVTVHFRLDMDLRCARGAASRRRVKSRNYIAVLSELNRPDDGTMVLLASRSLKGTRSQRRLCFPPILPKLKVNYTRTLT